MCRIPRPSLPGPGDWFSSSTELSWTDWSVKRAPDEELVAIVETDACGADAIQVMTGCTFGKGNFIFRNYGKHAFALADRKKGQTVRACLRPNTIPSNPEHVVLSEKVRNETASPEELEQYRNLKEERIQEILESPFESLFKIEEVSFPIPPEAQIVESEGLRFLRRMGQDRLATACGWTHGVCPMPPEGRTFIDGGPLS